MDGELMMSWMDPKDTLLLLDGGHGEKLEAFAMVAHPISLPLRQPAKMPPAQKAAARFLVGKTRNNKITPFSMTELEGTLEVFKPLA